MSVRQRFPAGPDIDVPHPADRLRTPDRLSVGDDRMVVFLGAFARRLLAW